MVIGIDASRANLAKRTGTEWYSYHLIRALAALDQNNYYRLYSKSTLKEGFFCLGPHWASRPLHWPPKRLWTHLRLSWEILLHAPDVLFVPAHTIPLIHPPLTVTTCHDIGFERYPELYTKIELAYHRWSMRRAIREAIKIIAVSEFTKKEIIDRYKIPAEKISVIYHGYDQKEFFVISNQQHIDSVLARYQIKKPFLLYVGRLEEKKNTPGLIKSFAILKKTYNIPHQLVLVGTPGYKYQEVTSLILKHSLGLKVLLPGYVAGGDLACLYNAADAFVFPSFYEGFGLPLLEAMACGTPIIASRTASIPEICAQAANLFDPKDPSDMAATIAATINDEGCKKNLKQEGLKRVTNFTWTRCAEKTLALLNSVGPVK